MVDNDLDCRRCTQRRFAQQPDIDYRITIPHWRAAALSKDIAVKRGVISPFVIHTRQGASYTRSGIHSAYRRADEELHGKAIGLNPKALRPFAATIAKKLGYRLDQLQVGLAHTSQRTTEGHVQQHETPVSEIALNLPDRSKPS
jgi:integrase